MKIKIFALISILLFVWFLLLGIELTLAWKQNQVVRGHIKLFGLTEQRKDVAKRLNVELSPNGRWYQWLEIEPPADFPIGTYPNTNVVGFRELDGWPVHYTDSKGMFNKDEWWTDPEILIVGDSFVTCEHTVESNSITYILNSRGIRTVNIGLTGSGPIFEMCAFRAYYPLVSKTVKLVVWIYYEGNDLQDIQEESKVPKYVEAAFQPYNFKPNQSLLNQLPKTDNLFGLQYLISSVCSLKRLRGAIDNIRGNPSEVKTFNKVLTFASAYQPNLLLIRIRKPGCHMDKQWKNLHAPMKAELPLNSSLYSGGYPTAHLTRIGYETLANIIEPQIKRLIKNEKPRTSTKTP